MFLTGVARLDLVTIEGYVPADVRKLPALMSDTEPRGIQPLNNSTCVEAHLYAMFAWHDIFDYLLLKSDADELLQEILREEIVNPLRTTHFVSSTNRITFDLALLLACSLPASVFSEELGISTGRDLSFPHFYMFISGPSRTNVLENNAK